MSFVFSLIELDATTGADRAVVAIPERDAYVPRDGHRVLEQLANGATVSSVSSARCATVRTRRWWLSGELLQRDVPADSECHFAVNSAAARSQLSVPGCVSECKRSHLTGAQDVSNNPSNPEVS